MPLVKSRPGFLAILGYGLLGMTVFLVSVWFTFPYDKFELRIENELAKKGLTADLSALSPGPFPGIKADSLTISAIKETPFRLVVAPLTVQLPLASLLSGDLVVKVEGKTLGGDFAGEIPLKSGRGTFSWKNLSLAKVSEDNADLLPPVGGTTSGSASFSMPVQTAANFSGAVNADISSLSVGPGQFGLINLAEVSLGSGKINLKAGEGKAEIENFSLSGGDIDIKSSGFATLVQPLMASSLDLAVTIRPAGSEVERKLPLLFAVLAPNKSPDGSYTSKIKGKLQALRFWR
ncbi:type II secretion system protein GspN [bacterium]|nr:MAG: type II secretion system protein GspN [bacterium]